ncbi:MAG: hypothetical protein ACR2K0_04075 [Acidimicrobiales bacterium]
MIDRWASQLDLFDDDATDRSRVVAAVTYADASGPVAGVPVEAVDGAGAGATRGQRRDRGRRPLFAVARPERRRRRRDSDRAGDWWMSPSFTEETLISVPDTRNS